MTLKINILKTWGIHFIVSFIGLLLSISWTPSALSNQTFKTGWYPWDPYQYLQESEGVSTLTGLDVKLLRAYMKEAGYSVKYEAVSWQEHQKEMKEGKRDIAAGATWTSQRAEYAYFSIPYRNEVNVLYMLKIAPDIKFKDIADFLSQIKRNKMRLGVIEGFIYADPLINAYIADPANAHLITKVGDDQHNLTNLLEHKIDGFIADQIVASTVAWRARSNSEIKQIMLGVSTPIHFMFSKKTVSPEVVEKVNKAIVNLKQSGAFFKIIKEYLFPVLLIQTVDRPWFLIIDILGTIAFAISGLMVAYRVRASILGALVFAALPAVGGGIIRDIIVDRKPIGVLTTPIYILAVVGTVLIGYILLKALSAYETKISVVKSQVNAWWVAHLLEFFDAIGLACFTVIGVVVCLMARCEPLWLWAPILAFITSTGGGILRDLVSSSRSISSLMGDLYGEIALFWGFMLALFMSWKEEDIQPDQIFYAVVGVIAGALITRLIAYHFKLRSPLFTD
ncbi:MAG: TRIC cation channel family protein [Alphaproteobacteria bacterium]|nr:TRIC cation channel family protein [Alphaproteobacteria bacterium]